VSLPVYFNKQDTLPMYLNVRVADYTEDVYCCIVDNGAAVNLIKDAVADTLGGICRMPSVVTQVTGVGNAVIPVREYVKLQLEFDTGFVTTPEEFYILPNTAIETPIVIGVTLLRANSLLPDMSTHQLFHRDGNRFQVVAHDTTKLASLREIGCSQNVEILPQQCQMVQIDIPIVPDKRYTFNTL
jgi:hypothetical protein